MVLSERSCMGVRDSIGYERPTTLSKKVLHGCERPTVLSENFYMGVREGVIRKVLLRKRKHTVMFIT